MSSEAPQKKNWQRRAFTFGIKLVLAALLVIWLLRTDRLDLSLITGLGFSARVVGFMFLGAAAVFGGQLLLAVRLRMLLAKQELNVSYSRALGLTLIGSFFGAILPGLISGDAVKAVYLLGDAQGGRSRAVAAVLIDRVLGLYSLFLLGALSLIAAWGMHLLPTRLVVLWIAPVAVLGMTAVLALAGWPKIGESAFIQRAGARTPERVRNLLVALHTCLRDVRLIWGAVGLSLINHALVIVTFLLSGILLADVIKPLAHYAVDPLAMVLNVVPLTPGGIGITEGAFSFLFEEIGSRNGAAIGLLGRFLQYLDYVIAGTVALIGVRFGKGRTR